MFRQIDNHKRTATIAKGLLTVWGDDGWENLLDSRTQFASDAEAKQWLGEGWEEYDPNADLKARGFVWNGYSYVMPNWVTP
jgi:hypothetical protein